jgi:hypothetical protein
VEFTFEVPHPTKQHKVHYSQETPPWPRWCSLSPVESRPGELRAPKRPACSSHLMPVLAQRRCCCVGGWTWVSCPLRHALCSCVCTQKTHRRVWLLFVYCPCNFGQPGRPRDGHVCDGRLDVGIWWGRCRRPVPVPVHLPRSELHRVHHRCPAVFTLVRRRWLGNITALGIVRLPCTC